jgi:hypothetical protein
MRNTLSLVATFALTAVVAAGACSSSGSGGSGTGGTSTTSGTTSATNSGTTSATGTGGHTGSTTGTGGSTGSTTGTGGGSSSGGPCYQGTSGYTALTAAPTPAQHANACASTDISAFIAACITASTGCDAWFTNNVMGDAADGGGAGTACGNCIFPVDSSGNPLNTGGTFSTVVGTGANATLLFGPNYSGCIQLKDTTHGAACALAMDNLNNCEEVACAFDGTTQCSDANFTTCANFVTGTGQGCNAAASSTSACATDDADGGAAQICSPSGGSSQSTDFTYVINLFCGTG